MRLGGARPGSVFREHDYRLLLSAFAISKMGSWAYNVGLAVFVFDATHSPAWVGGATLTRFLAALLLSPYAGVIAERFERVRLMMASDLSALVFMGALAVAALLHAPVVVAVALAGLTSAVTTVYSPAAKAMTPAVVSEEHLAAANSHETTIDNIAVVLGPAVGAGLLLIGPPALAFAVNAASFALSAGLESRLRVRSQPTDVTEGGSFGALKQIAVGITSVFASPVVTLLVSFSVVASFIYGTDTVLFVVLSQDFLGTGPDGYGFLLAGLGVGGILGALVMDRVASSPRLGTLIAVGMVVYCLPTALVSAVHIPAVVFVLQLIRGIGTVVVDVLAVTALQRLVGRELIARVFGAFYAFVLAATCVGTLIAPLMLSTIGLRGALLVMGLAIPGMVVISYPRLRAVDRAGLQQLAKIEPRVTVLKRLDIFAGATRPVLERLALACVEEKIPGGTILIREGDPADDFFVLVHGKVEVTGVGETGAPHMLGTLAPPAYFGEIGLLERLSRTATVRTLIECTVFRISGTEFLEAMTTAPISASALGLAQVRLARTHPSRTMTFHVAGAGEGSGGGSA